MSLDELLAEIEARAVPGRMDGATLAWAASDEMASWAGVDPRTGAVHLCEHGDDLRNLAAVAGGHRWALAKEVVAARTDIPRLVAALRLALQAHEGCAGDPAYDQSVSDRIARILRGEAS